MLPLLTEIKLNDVNILLTMLGEDSVQTHNCNTNILFSIAVRDLPRDAERQEVRADGGGAGHPRAARPPAAAGQPAARPRDVPRRAVHRAGTVLYCTALYCTVLYYTKGSVLHGLANSCPRSCIQKLETHLVPARTGQAACRVMSSPCTEYL